MSENFSFSDNVAVSAPVADFSYSMSDSSFAAPMVAESVALSPATTTIDFSPLPGYDAQPTTSAAAGAAVALVGAGRRSGARLSAVGGRLGHRARLPVGGAVPHPDRPASAGAGDGLADALDPAFLQSVSGRLTP